MVDRSTRCISQVFGFLKDVESCENCDSNTGNDLEADFVKSNLLKKSVSDTKIFTSPQKHQPQITRKCICQLTKPLPENKQVNSNSDRSTLLENRDNNFGDPINGTVCSCDASTVKVDPIQMKLQGETETRCDERSTNGICDSIDEEVEVQLREKDGTPKSNGRTNTQVVSEMFRFLNTGSVLEKEDVKSDKCLQRLSSLIENEEREIQNDDSDSESKFENDKKTLGHEPKENWSVDNGSKSIKHSSGDIQLQGTNSEERIVNMEENVKIPCSMEERTTDQTASTHNGSARQSVEGTMPDVNKTIDCVSQVISEVKSKGFVEKEGGTSLCCHGDGLTNGDVLSGEVDKRDKQSTSTENSPGVVKRRKHSSRKSEGDDHSDDTSDEDTGIYAESHRNSRWIRLDEDAEPSPIKSASLPTRKITEGSVDVRASSASMSDEVFTEGRGSPPVLRTHKRSDSSTTTLSETEFQRQYTSRRRCLIQRDDSQQEYHRLSARFYDEERVLIIQKEEGEADQDFGLHILDCQPAYITSIDPGSPAARAGAQEGQILISVNGVNVLEAGHDEIVQLMQQNPSLIKLEVAYSDFQPVRDLEAQVMAGYMYKLGNSTLMRTWKKRYFVLRQDNCLYYYKTEHERIPLGAVPLTGYSISRYIDTNKDFCFKADKYGARSYYFMTDSRDVMTGWVGKMTEAAARSKKRKDSWLDVSSHNVGLPALEIRRPESTGYLSKMGRQRKVWKKRYCVLKDACIYYYKLMSSHSAQGVAHLHGYEVDEKGLPGKRYSFILRPPEPGMRTFYFSAEHETDKARWVDAMRRSIQRWVKVDN